MTAAEAEAVAEMLTTCEDPPMVEVRKSLGTNMEGIRLEPTEETLSGEPMPELQNPVYGSCETRRPRGSRGCRAARTDKVATVG